MSLIIDCHGHYTTAPQPLEDWRNKQIAAYNGDGPKPDSAELKISDDEIRESIEKNQLRLMNERGIDVTLFSPRASFMAHHIGDFEVSQAWTAICNDMCYRVSQLFPDRFVPVAMLPQSPGVPVETCIPELERCVNELGNVGVNLNPDPSGGSWSSPPLTDRYWYPLYEKLVEYNLPAMVHVSTCCNPCHHTTGDHYLNADTTAFMQLLKGDLFKDFPELRLIVPHGGGAAPYHWGRFRASFFLFSFFSFSCVPAGFFFLGKSGPAALDGEQHAYQDVVPFARRLMQEFPDRVLFGTDWPAP
ncbi:amidohydrolase [Oligella ureolytica]